MAVTMDDDAEIQVREVLADLRIPLENVEFAVEQYLRENACRLDPQTRFLLAGVRDCIGRVASTTREMVARTPVRDEATQAPRQAEPEPRALAS